MDETAAAQAQRRYRRQIAGAWALGLLVVALMVWSIIAEPFARELPHCDTGAMPCIRDGTVYGEGPETPADPGPISPYAP